MTVFLLISFAFITIIAASLAIGAVIDDVRSITRSRHPRTQRSQPLVTILLATDDDTPTTQQALESTLQSSYQRLELIILCAPSIRTKLQKATTELRRQKHTVNIFSGTPNWENAYRRYGHGTIILTLRCHDRLHSEAIGRAVRHFDTQPDTTVIYPNSVTTRTPYSTVSLLQTYTTSLGRLWGKMTNTLESTTYHAGPAFYRKPALAKAQENHALPAYFADDAITYVSPATPTRTLPATMYHALVRHYRSLLRPRTVHPPLTVWRWLLAISLSGALITLPFLTAYALSLAIVARQPLLLFLGVAIASLYTLFGIWTNPGLKWRRKIYFSVLLPICLLPFSFAAYFYGITLIVMTARQIQTTVPRSIAKLKKPSFS